MVSVEKVHIRADIVDRFVSCSPGSQEFDDLARQIQEVSGWRSHFSVHPLAESFDFNSILPQKRKVVFREVVFAWLAQVGAHIEFRKTVSRGVSAYAKRLAW